MRRVVLLLLLVGVPSCRSAVTAPAPIEVPSASASSSALAVASEGRAPELLGISSRVEGGFWVLRARIGTDVAPPGAGSGWTLQIYWDTDQVWGTGYAHRYERMAYVDTWPTVDGLFEVWDTAEETWRFIGYGGLEIGAGRLEARVPLAMLGDDGALDWRLETFVDGGAQDFYWGSTQVTALAYRFPRRSARPLRSPHHP